jgi:hypothetical protein
MCADFDRIQIHGRVTSLFKRKSLVCWECDCTIHGNFAIINGDIYCSDCALEYMENEFDEKKLKDSGWYLEVLSDALGIKIWEAD